MEKGNSDSGKGKMPSLQQKLSACAGCDRPDSVEDMVQCDNCDSWWHYSCAKVDETVKERDFVCKLCTSRKSKSRSGKSTSSSARARMAVIELELKRLEDERALADKLEKEREELNKKAREEEKAYLAEKRVREEAFLKKKYDLMQEAMAELDDGSSEGSRSVQSSKSKVEKWIRQQKQNVGTGLGVAQSQTVARVASSAVTNLNVAANSNTGAIPKTLSSVNRSKVQSEVPNIHSAQISDSAQYGDEQLMAKQMASDMALKPYQTRSHLDYENRFAAFTVNSVPQRNVNMETTATNRQFEQQTAAPVLAATSAPILQDATEGRENLSGDRAQRSQRFAEPVIATGVVQQISPTVQQLAARQVVPKELPVFSGHPSEWPMFINAYTNSTELCGYSDGENLMRLQKCLKGNALEAVRSYLLLPSSVPVIISTLGILYGRPEKIIYNLLSKVRSAPSPKAEKLETLVSFGLTVQNLCNYLKAAGQEAQLKNPSILQELVDKLPACIKLDWALYKRYVECVDLGTFGEYMSSIVAAASDVVSPSFYEQPKMERGKHKGFFGAHIEGVESEEEINEYSARTKSGKASVLKCLVCENEGHKAKECAVLKNKTVEERLKVVEKLNLCRRCLIPHGRWPCRVKENCGVDGCEGRHHKLLHPRGIGPKLSNFPSTTANTIAAHRDSSSDVLFRIVPVVLHGKCSSINTFALLDDGSSVTLLEEDLAKQIGVDGEAMPLCLKWTADISRNEIGSRSVNLEICTIS